MTNTNTNIDQPETTLEDLTVREAAHISGGPRPQSQRTIVLKSSVNDEPDEGDTLRGFSLNHNETVAEDTEETTHATDATGAPDAIDTNVADLTVTNDAQVVGGRQRRVEFKLEY